MKGRKEKDRKESGYLIYDSELKNPTRQSNAAMQICIILALDHH